MTRGLTITVVDPDSDYLGIEIRAVSQRFAGSTRIYAGLDELSAFANLIAGFHRDTYDERQYEFGNRARSFAGGYCGMRFYCLDQSGHPALDFEIEDDAGKYARESAKFTFRIDPAALDRFIKRLCEIEQEGSGDANLPIAL